MGINSYKMVINTNQNQAEKREIKNVVKIHIFSDSQCAIGHLTLGWEAFSKGNLSFKR